MTDPHQPFEKPLPPERPGRSAGWATALCLVAVFLAAGAWLVLSGYNRGRGAYDQHHYHLPAIRTFAAALPRPDLSDYLSATTPGYHLLLAAFVRSGVDDPVALRAIGAVFTVALLAILGVYVGRRLGWLMGLAACLPMAASLYVLFPGVWLQPDNAGWLGVLSVLLLGLHGRWAGRGAWRTYALAGLAVAVLVWVRQSHLWAAGVVWVAAWLGESARAAEGLGVLRPTRERAGRAALALLVTLPAFLSIAWLYRLWGGFTPPHFHQQHGTGLTGVNPAVPAFALSLAAVYSAFFGAWVWPGLMRLWREQRWVLWACVGVGVVLALVPETTYLYESRGTGLWNVVDAMDRRGLKIGGRTSPLLLGLAPAGLVALAAWLAVLPERARWVLGLGTLGFVLAQSANANAWQRYLEPFFLILLPLCCALEPAAERPQGRLLKPAALAGPLVLAVLLALVTLRAIQNGEAVV